MRKLESTLLVTVALLTGSLATAAVARQSPPPPTSTYPTPTSTGTIPAANVKTYLESLAKVAIPATVSVVGKAAKTATYQVYNPSTQQFYYISGAGVATSFSGQGSTPASGSVVTIGGYLTSQTSWAAGTGTLAYYQLNDPQATSLPSDPAGADAKFRELFGNGALRSGESLATPVRNKKTSKILAWCFRVSLPAAFTIIDSKGQVVLVQGVLSMTKTVTVLNGKVVAIFSCGAGAAGAKI
jgi:hypothetical protein